MVQNVKTSYGFYDIEQAMIDLVDNIQRIKKDRQANLSSLKEERNMIEKEVEQTRIKINAELDKFQEDIMKELYEAESKESKMIDQLLKSIEKNEKEIIGYQENLVNIKQHASDLQTFLAMKQIQRDLAEKYKYVTALVTSNKLNRVSLSCKMNEALLNVFNKIRKFGEVIISSRSSDLKILRKNETQAQIAMAFAPSKSIDNIALILQATIDTMIGDIGGCTLLPDSRMVFSRYKYGCVVGFKTDGCKDFEIRLHPKVPFDITYIHDNNTIAVTGGLDRYITIIDVESMTVIETIQVESFNYGVVSRNNTLIYCAANCGLHMMNLTDTSVENIVTSKIPPFSYVASFGDKLYYTNAKKHTVTCCDLHGAILWEFQDKNILNYSEGICVDNDGNVYVASNVSVDGFLSHTCIVISPDGQRHRQLLFEEYDHQETTVLHFDKSTNQLVVVDVQGKAFLYKLERRLY